MSTTNSTSQQSGRESGQAPGDPVDARRAALHHPRFGLDSATQLCAWEEWLRFTRDALLVAYIGVVVVLFGAAILGRDAVWQDPSTVWVIIALAIAVMAFSIASAFVGSASGRALRSPTTYEAVDALLRTLESEDYAAYRAASRIFVTSLPMLTSASWHLSREHNALLNRVLLNADVRDELPLQTAILRVLALKGGEASIPCVEELSQMTPATYNERRLRAAARHCLAAMRRRLTAGNARRKVGHHG